MLNVLPRKTAGNGNREVYPLARLRDEFDAVVNRFYAGLPLFFDKPGYPEMTWGFNLEETDKEYLVYVEAPGFEIEDFNVFVTGNMLTLRADHKEKAAKKTKEEDFVPFAERSFARCFTLPPGVNAEKIDATYKNGILEVHIPKSEETKPRRVTVKT